MVKGIHNKDFALNLKVNYMRVLIIFLFLSVLVWPVFGQNWFSDLSIAKTRAQQDDRNIVLVFAGSDWCVPCIRLEKEIWEAPEFKSLAKDHFIMLKADFPRKKQNRLSPQQQEKNDQLAEIYNKKGDFPLVVLLDSHGVVLGKTGYRKTSPEEYFNHLTSFEN